MIRARLISVVLVGALALPGVAGARDSGRRLKTAGVVSTAVGFALAIIGAVLTGYGETHPPSVGPIIYGTVRSDCCDDNAPSSTPPNRLLAGGASALAVGVAALAIGIPLWIAGERQEHRPTLHVTAGGLRLTF